MKTILEEYLRAIETATERIARSEEALGDWRLAPAVRALMAMKGFRTVAAMRSGGSSPLWPSVPGHGLSGVDPDGEDFQ